MGVAKVAITLEASLLERLDRMVRLKQFPNRSQAIQTAVREKLERLDRTRLARECAKLNPGEEKLLAEEGILDALDEWPEF